jgi:hypothetical protein
MESIYNAKNKIKFRSIDLEDKYPIIKYFTNLNNKFKHYKNKYENKTILTNITFMGGSQSIELQFNFYENEIFIKGILYREFVDFFLTFLIDNNKIEIN